MKLEFEMRKKKIEKSLLIPTFLSDSHFSFYILFLPLSPLKQEAFFRIETKSDKNKM